MSYSVEKDWITHAGFRAVVTLGDMGFCQGYVGVTSEHPLFGISYSEPTDKLIPASEDDEVGKRGIFTLISASINGFSTPEAVFDVHGGLTYANNNKDYPVKSDLWWFGYDCGHAGDGRRGADNYEGDIIRSVDYCINECESLAGQILRKTITNKTV